MEAPSPLNLTDCNHQLVIRCIYDTKSLTECSSWPPQMKEKAYLASLTEGRHGCAHVYVIQCSSDDN